MRPPTRLDVNTASHKVRPFSLRLRQMVAANRAAKGVASLANANAIEKVRPAVDSRLMASPGPRSSAARRLKLSVASLSRET